VPRLRRSTARGLELDCYDLIRHEAPASIAWGK